ncbi:MAG: LTA synthase family protein [Lactobacillaceae bacterium]|jgi:lipoteichoic acid synthase|nr:LTA synthase family protein [Lactobacillaceae bacterium]
MKTFIQNLKTNFSNFSRSSLIDFFLINLFFITIKNFIEYLISFNLGIESFAQFFIAFINPIPTAIILLSIALYFKGRKAYWIMLLVNLVQSIWLFANMLYYREFSDFLSVSIISSGSSVGENLSKAILGILHPTDFLVFLDILVLAVLLLTKQIKTNQKSLNKPRAFMTTLLGFVLVFVNYGVASVDRSGLLTRSFDNNYLVKYLGLNEYILVNSYQNYAQAQSRNSATSKQLEPIKKWIADNRAADNVEYFGTQKGKNVIVFHLESFQQFLIDYKVDGHEVTPNLNAFYHDQNTLSFDNFYNQVGQGKTSDAETMLDTGLFGLPSGSAMVKYGTKNTFEAAPANLRSMGYTTAAFHGDVPTFWNRNNAYKQWGYDYYFSKDFYPNSDVKSLNLGYGMLDKVFLDDSAEYLEQLPQPFYAKLITVTNHYPYLTNSELKYSFPETDTGDKTVDSYVQTAHYVDQAFGEFMTYLKKTGLYENTVVYVYGDHYGISENHPDAIAKLLGKDSVNGYDLTQWQKVPFMVHSSNLKGGIDHTYGGEIDVMPTLYDLLGVNDDQTTIFGHDLLSDQNRQIVAFRNADWVTPTLMKKGDSYFDMSTGEQIKEKSLTSDQKKLISSTQAYVDKQLSYSDEVITGDLLRFDKNGKITGLNISDFNYQEKATTQSLNDLEKSKPSSVKAKNSGKLTGDYETDEIMLLPKDQQKEKLAELKQKFSETFENISSSFSDSSSN